MKKRRNVSIGILILSMLVLAGCSKQVENKEISLTIGEESFEGIYTGTMEGGIPNGNATFTACDDKKEALWTYTGIFEKGLLKGECMLEDFPVTVSFDQNEYRGTYSGSGIDGLPDGEGTFISQTEETLLSYTGSFSQGIISGDGKVENMSFVLAIENEEYQGNYTGDVTDGKPYGNGIFEYDEENIQIKYEGEWEDGKLFGEGKLDNNVMCIHFEEVDRVGKFNGNTKNGIPNGEGKFEATTDDDISYTYTGNWKNGKWDGYGEHVYEENDLGLLSQKGTFTENKFTPTLGELMGYLSVFEGRYYQVTQEKMEFIDKNRELFLNRQVYDFSDLVDEELTYEKYTKKSYAYVSSFMKLDTLAVNQIFESNSNFSPNGIITELYCYNINNVEQIYYICYFDELPDVYEGTKIKMIGVPVSVGYYDNIGGGQTNCIFALGSKIDVVK